MARIASRHGNPDSRARMKIELGPAVQVLANLGVIAGIAVLALELKQNNELLASQARSNLDANRVAQQRIIIEDLGGVADLVFRSGRGEELSGLERWRLTAWRSMMIHSFDSMYQEVRHGPLEESDLPVTQWAAAFSSDPGLQDHWASLKATLDPDFVRFMEERVLVLMGSIPRPQ
jgi:hypothetical protein